MKRTCLFKLIHSVHDWTHNEEDYVQSVAYDPLKFLLTNTDLVTDTDPKKSHLWSLNADGSTCGPVAEYKHIQFMRPSALHAGLAVGHAPLWRRKHGCYFVSRRAPWKPLKPPQIHPSYKFFTHFVRLWTWKWRRSCCCSDPWVTKNATPTSPPSTRHPTWSCAWAPCGTSAVDTWCIASSVSAPKATAWRTFFTPTDTPSWLTVKW